MYPDHAAAHEEAVRRMNTAAWHNEHRLSLSELPIRSLPAELAELSSLTELDLLGCDQLTNITSLELCPQLLNLNLRFCRQVQDLQPLSALIGLQSLDLRGWDQLQDLQPLAALIRLQSLDLSYCSQLWDLQPLSSLRSLQSLNLESCDEVQDLQPLSALIGLLSLNLSWCVKVRDLQPLSPLVNLRTLRLFSGLPIDCAPGAKPLASWGNLQDLYADRLLAAPSQLASNFSDNILPRIRAWQQDLALGEAPNTIIKVFVLGNGGVGKTQVCRRLQGLTFDLSIPSTHGIDIAETQLAPPNKDQPEITSKLWDFGGQDIYLGTHGLFLDDRAIYVLAWSPEFENSNEIESEGVIMRNRPLAYWIEYVRSIAGPTAPVIVVQTRCDTEANIQPAPLPVNHGFKYLRTTSSSAHQDDGMERIELELKRAAREQFNEYGKVRLPSSWVAIGSRLVARRDQKTMALSDFETLCRESHSSAPPSVVLEYLHRSGQIFYHAGAFQDQVILDLDWALKGIYAVLDRDRALPFIRSQSGRFTPQLLAALVWQQYGPEEHKLFLYLMQQCQICFKIAEDLYIAPAHLPNEAQMKPAIAQVWRGATPDAAAQLDYEFLHEGVLRAVLCGLGEKAGVHAVYWAYGICFYDETLQSTALIRSALPAPDAKTQQGSITVEACGPHADKLVQDLSTVRRFVKLKSQRNTNE